MRRLVLFVLAALCLTAWAAAFLLLRSHFDESAAIIPTLMVLPAANEVRTLTPTDVPSPTILPTEIGLIGFTDAGRVYVDGESPGGWHTAAGGGAWIALWKSGYNVNVLYTNRSNRRVIVNLGFEY